MKLWSLFLFDFLTKKIEKAFIEEAFITKYGIYLLLSEIALAKKFEVLSSHISSVASILPAS